MQKFKVIVFTQGERHTVWLVSDASSILLDERELCRRIPNFSHLDEKGRCQAENQLLAGYALQCRANAEIFLPNARRNLKAISGRVAPSRIDLQQAVYALLSFSQLFADPSVGYYMLATLLSGLRCTALRGTEESFRPILSFPSLDPVVCRLIQIVVKACVTRKRWQGKACHIKRHVILDYRVSAGELPHHIQDFSTIKVHTRKKLHLLTPSAYTDTVAALIGATSAQLREATPYLEHAALFLLGCGPVEWKAHRLTETSLAHYDPEIAKLLERERMRIAVLLRLWWCDDEDSWAKTVCAEARATFGKPDNRYISVMLDPKRLRNAIYFQVLLSFFDWVEQSAFLTTAELAPYRAGAKAVFDPAPQPERVIRRTEDPEVFLEVMRDLVEKHQEKIVAESSSFHKADKPFGAWRTISGVCYLVMLETGWKAAYVKACRKAGDLDCAFLQRERWPQELQKILCEAGVIKAPSAGFRYRYDLCQTGAKDSTYVIAVPRTRLESP